MFQRVLSLVICVGFATASLTASGQDHTSYPVEIADFAHWEKFPAECAGYRRSTVRSYAPALANYSVTYQSFGSTLQNAVTLFFYPRTKDSSAQLQAEESQILNAYKDAHIVNRRSINLESNGKKHDATLITFEFTGSMAEGRSKLSSQLLIAFLETRTFKVRSTTLAETGTEAEAAVQELLQCVAWAT
ncbi:hypothetical protein [Pseudoduganella sp. HUAS MS19]